jgi:hypothetical protein
MKENEIDLSKLDLARMKDRTTDTPGLLPYAHTSGSALVKPEDMGKVKGRAVAAMYQQTDMQMAQLYEQMKLLAEQANAIKKRVEISERIYRAKMSFEPLISHVYYLYRRPTAKIFSRWSPRMNGVAPLSLSSCVRKCAYLPTHLGSFRTLGTTFNLIASNAIGGTGIAPAPDHNPDR